MSGKASSMPLNDLTQIRQFMTGNGFIFAFFDTPWMSIYIFKFSLLFHPIFGFFAIFAGIVLTIFAIMNENTTKVKLAEANKLIEIQTYLSMQVYVREVYSRCQWCMQSMLKKIWQKILWFY